MLIIYIGSGIGGTLFGSVCNSNLAVGSDVAYFGFPSAMLSAVIVNWHALEPIGMMRACLIFMCVFLTLFLLIFTSAQYNTGNYYFDYFDMYGHFGSWFTGLCLGMMLMRRVRRRG